MTDGEIDIKLYSELYTRSRALLRRGNVESFDVGDFLIEGMEGGGLWVFFRDPIRGIRLIMDCNKDGDVGQALADGEIPSQALAAVRAHMILDDLSEI